VLRHLARCPASGRGLARALEGRNKPTGSLAAVLDGLQAEGLVARHGRLGFYRPDAMPAALKLYLDAPG
jgi:hypothetical protein